MNPNKQAGRMILTDLQLFNHAAVLLEKEIEPEILFSFTKVIQDWIKESNWIAELNDENIDYSWIAPEIWRYEGLRGCDDANPYFSLDRAVESDSYSLADLCGVGTVDYSFWFVVDEKRLEIPKRKFKISWAAMVQNYIGRLKLLGFIYDGSRFHIPLRLDAARLADAWDEGDYEDFLVPLVVVLKSLAQAVPIFQEMITELESAAVI